MFAVTYVPFMAGFVMLMLSEPNGPRRVLLFVVLAVANDVGGFAAGSLFGRHPIAPSVSPKKSWEGFFGSLILALIIGPMMGLYYFDGAVVVGATLAAATVVFATLDDVSESLIERDVRIKYMRY